MRFVLEVGRRGVHVFREAQLEALTLTPMQMQQDVVPYDRARQEEYAARFDAAIRARLRMALEAVRETAKMAARVQEENPGRSHSAMVVDFSEALVACDQLAAVGLAEVMDA